MKTSTNSPAMMAVLVFCALLIRPADSMARELDQPGKHAVGYARIAMAFTGSQGERRPVDVDVWYPADRKQFAAAPAAVYKSRLHDDSRLAWKLTSTVAREAVAIDGNGPPFPLVIFSHGNLNTPLEYVLVPEHLASHGYVVAAPWHTRNNQDDVRVNFLRTVGITLPCLDLLPRPCVTPQTDPRTIMANRIRDIGGIIDSLPGRLDDRVDIGRVAVMGHSRGSGTALMSAGGSASWGIPRDQRVRAIIGLAATVPEIVANIDVGTIAVPTLLLAAELDANTPSAISEGIYGDLSENTERAYVVLADTVHRSFASAFCRQMEAAGTVGVERGLLAAWIKFFRDRVLPAPPAILDLHLLVSVLDSPENGSTVDYCTYDAFTDPADITPIVEGIIPAFDVTESSVPRLGVSSNDVHRLVAELSVRFLKATLAPQDDDVDDEMKPYLNAKFVEKYAALIKHAERQGQPSHGDE